MGPACVKWVWRDSCASTVNSGFRHNGTMHNDFVHPRQSLFLHSIHTNWRLNIDYIIFSVYACHLPSYLRWYPSLWKVDVTSVNNSTLFITLSTLFTSPAIPIPSTSMTYAPSSPTKPTSSLSKTNFFLKPISKSISNNSSCCSPHSDRKLCTLAIVCWWCQIGRYIFRSISAVFTSSFMALPFIVAWILTIC